MLLDRSYISVYRCLIGYCLLLRLYIWLNCLTVLSIYFIVFVFTIVYFFRWILNINLEVKLQTQFISLALKHAIKWFIVSEAFLFSRFFWSYFNFLLSADTNTRIFPANLYTNATSTLILDRWGVPLLNTVILLSSRVTLTMGHQCLLLRIQWNLQFYLLLSFILRAIFTGLQRIEYYEAPFNISHRSFRSIFYMATRFHRIHVLIRSRFLLYNFCRNFFNIFNVNKHVRFEARAWYWHFVDVVWLFLFFFIYSLN